MKKKLQKIFKKPVKIKINKEKRNYSFLVVIAFWYKTEKASFKPSMFAGKGSVSRKEAMLFYDSGELFLFICRRNL